MAVSTTPGNRASATPEFAPAARRPPEERSLALPECALRVLALVTNKSWFTPWFSFLALACMLTSRSMFTPSLVYVGLFTLASSQSASATLHDACQYHPRLVVGACSCLRMASGEAFGWYLEALLAVQSCFTTI